MHREALEAWRAEAAARRAVESARAELAAELANTAAERDRAIASRITVTARSSSSPKLSTRAAIKFERRYDNNDEDDDDADDADEVGDDVGNNGVADDGFDDEPRDFGAPAMRALAQLRGCVPESGAPASARRKRRRMSSSRGTPLLARARAVLAEMAGLVEPEEPEDAE